MYRYIIIVLIAPILACKPGHQSQERISVAPVIATSLADTTGQIKRTEAEWKAILTPEQYHVLREKGTDPRFTGKFTYTKDKGTYSCAACGQQLFTSDMKFDSECGWPSFDDELPGAIDKHTDADGRRVEILCSHCGGHLGHVFTGERMTAKNTRHCVNSISMKFIKEGDPLPEILES